MLSTSLVARVTVGMALLAASSAVTSCSGLPETDDKGYISGDGRVVQFAADVRGAPVELVGQSLEGDAIDLAERRGRIVVVNLWWSGCPPCRTEMPVLADVAEEHDEAAFVGINIRDSSQAAGLAFQEKAGVPYPSIYSPEGQATLAFSGVANVVAVPTTIVLDHRGRIAAVINGEVPSATTLSDLIEDVEGEG